MAEFDSIVIASFYFKFVGQKLVLYCRRINVDMHNAECLARHPGDMTRYDAIDKGQSKGFDSRFLAEKVNIE